MNVFLGARMWAAVGCWLGPRPRAWAGGPVPSKPGPLPRTCPLLHCCCLSVCLSACLPACLPVCLPACLSLCLSVSLSLCLCLSVSLSPGLSVCLLLCLSIFQSVCLLLCLSMFVTGELWTGSPHKSIDQIGKNCPKNVRKLCFQAPDNFWTFFGHFFDIFRTFCRHSLFWAVQRFARYNSMCFSDI